MATRDIDGDYKQALLREYEDYLRSGAKSRARAVARVLRDRYGHDVEPAPKSASTAEEAAPERTDAEPAPDRAVDPKPRRRPRKTADSESAE